MEVFVKASFEPGLLLAMACCSEQYSIALEYDFDIDECNN